MSESDGENASVKHAEQPRLADIGKTLMEASHLSEDDELRGALAEKAREDLANYLREFDSGNDESPMWTLSKDDVEDYVGCELADIAFGALGTSAILVFERDDGSLHGLKLAPRENIRVCDVEVSA